MLSVTVRSNVPDLRSNDSYRLKLTGRERFLENTLGYSIFRQNGLKRVRRGEGIYTGDRQMFF